MLAARVTFGNRARVVGLACSPRMQTSSPTTKLLAGMPACASEAAAERVFSALAVTVTGGSYISTVVYLKKVFAAPGLGLGHGQRFRARGSANGAGK